MFILFFLIWVIFNGKLTVEIAVFGLIISAAMYLFMCKYLEFSPKKDLRIFKNAFLGVRYGLVLLKEIILANIKVIGYIYSSKYEVEPALIKFKTDLKSDASKAVLANSITLTPGTITGTLEKDELCVHCLDKEMGDGIDDMVFMDLLKKMEEKK